MKKNFTEVVFIIDRSGSMSGLEKDTIGGFNSMLAKQSHEPGEAYVSTVLFDDSSEVLHDRVKLAEVPFMTEEDYYVRGCTALLDAIGGAIHHIGNIHKYAREEDRPDKTLFIITTDGMENASRWYSYERVKGMIERQQSKYGWEFIFIGANIDSIGEAARLGIRPGRAVNYVNDSEGVEAVYGTVGMAMSAVMNAAPQMAGCTLDSVSWTKSIDDDMERRMGRGRR